jgi:hypothetical protein
MSTVEELIGNLLLRHNCVIVPSFGGFVAKQTSATIDYKNGVMLPPRKSILFNRQLINNDGLLISEYAATNKVYYSSAEASVKYSVSDWNEKLRNGERVTLDRVGHLFYDQEKNICFEQDRFFNLLLESYGLGKVHFVSEEDLQIVQHISEISPIHQEEKEIEETPFRLVALPIIEDNEQEEESNIVEHPALKSKSKVWKYIAAAVLLPVGFYSFWIPMKTNVLESGVLSFRDFNTSYKSNEGIYEKSKFVQNKIKYDKSQSLETEIKNLPSDVYVYSYPFTDGLFIPVQLKTGKQEITEPVIDEVIINDSPEKKVETTPKPIVSKSGSFDYVVNCFSSEENATAFVSLLKGKGLNAYVVSDKTGPFRVSAGNATSSDEINTVAEKSKSLGFTGWILKK